MGRRKLEIKRIEEKSARQVTFSKRRNGLMKKAKELSVLCDLDIGVLVYSARGKLYHYCSNNSLNEILQRYQSTLENDPSPSSGDCEAHDQYSKYSRFLTCKDLLQVVESDADEACPDELSVNDLVHLEQQLEAALTQTRMTKTHLLLDSISGLHEKEKMLEDEKKFLKSEMGGSKRKRMAIDLNVAPDE